MKKITLIIFLITGVAFSQINDATGNTGRGTDNTFLTGNIGVGIPGGGTPLLMLSIGDRDSGIVGGANTLDLYTNNNSQLSIDVNGIINVSNQLNINESNFSLLLKGDGVIMRNNLLSGGWGRTLVGMSNLDNSQSWMIGGFGVGQSHQYGFIGQLYNNKAINWTIDNKVGIGLPITTAPNIMLAVGDRNSGLIGGDGTLEMVTNQTARLSIDNSGNINIGSSGNNSELQVFGNIQNIGHIQTQELNLNPSTNMSLSLKGDGIIMTNNVLNGGWGRSLIGMSNQDNSQTWMIGGFGSGQSHRYGFIGQLYNDTAIKWTIDNNVGIGLPTTTEPGIMLAIGDSDTGFVGGNNTLDMFTNNISRLHIDDSGNVGVGLMPSEIPSGYKFAVSGRIIGEEVRVQLQSSWPDYVFAAEYNLLPLELLENYILKNGHLQNIPSAEEVEKNGILLGEMNAKLLEKIEELTLYTIQQQKELNSQKEQNLNLEKRLLEIEAKLLILLQE